MVDTGGGVSIEHCRKLAHLSIEPTGTAMTPRTLFDKIWDAHIVRPQTAETPAVIYIDLHLIHEVTSPQAFTELRQRGERLRS